MKYIKSSFSQLTCVVAGQDPDTGNIHVRDSKSPHRPAFAFTSDEWAAFIAGVKNDEFDFGLTGEIDKLIAEDS